MQVTKNNFQNVLFYIFLFFVFWGVIKTEDNSNTAIYFVTVIYMVAFIIGRVLTKKSLFITVDVNLLIALIFIFCWGYGVLVGILNGNSAEYIVRNFSGMLLYPLLLLLVSNLKLSHSKLVSFLLVISCMVSVLNLISYIVLFVFQLGVNEIWSKIPILNAYWIGIEDGSFSLIYSATKLMMIIYAYALYNFLYYKKYFSWWTLIIIAIGCIVIVVTKSGGVALQWIATTMIMFFSLISKKVSIKSLFFIGCLMCVLLLLIMISNFNPVGEIFSHEDGGNVVRYMEIEYIMENLTIEGAGLGATYGAIGKSYGIEVIYLDLLYKLGLVSLLIYGIYIYSFFKSIKLLNKTKGDWKDAVPLALLGYIWYSFGNPALFSGGRVLAHILALLMIKKRSYNEES